MDQQNPTLAKIPILDTGKFEQWQFRIQQYLQHEHYALWEVIEFGDSYEAPKDDVTTASTSDGTGKKKGRTVTLTTDDMQKRKNDVKARTTLLLALPDEHQLCFSKHKTTQELWDAILKTFGDNEATKKTKKNLLKQYRNEEVNVVSVSTASANIGAANISQDTACAYIASQSSGSQIKFKDINQINEDDMEEMDIKWNMALLSMRADRFWKKTGKKITIQGTDVAEFDKSKVKCFNCHKMGHFAPKALMAIDEVGWDWSYMANDEENHALVADEEARLPKFADDTVTDYSKPPHAIESITDDLQNRDPSITKTGASPNKGETVKKPTVKYAELYKKPSKSSGVKMGRTSPKNNYTHWSYWNSGCSRHMTCNISYLFDYEPFDGGYVSFGQGGCKITGKGTIKTERDQREFSNARTPQQNGVVERRNMTLIEAARTMLADAKLPVTFWAEAVNTACYVQNRVLVNKSHNKTPYELFNSRTPTRGFLKPFGCHVMILNTLDNLGKFEAKGDEGYFIGYSMSSKTFRVFNKRTKRVEENLHVDFLKNKAIEKGAGLNWLFDIDSLTKSINYVPVVVAGTNSTNFLGTKDAARQDPHDACNTDEPESSGNFNPTATLTNLPTDQIKALIVETSIPTVSSPGLTACFTDSQEPSSDTRLISKRVTNQEKTPSLDNILTLANMFEDMLRVTTNLDESNGVEADVSNMETTITASLTPTLRIHKDHPKSKIIGPVDTPIQTRHKSKETLVDCLKGVRPIRTKWVLKNKKDERGIVIRKKARLVAQGHTQEEGIDYDEVFLPVARIEAIRLFLAYASFIGFTVYEMDVKSAFLYGTIDEEVYVIQPLGFQDPEYPARVYKVEKAMYGLHQAPRA
nr:hypothetical protein [Tanacetum cinerariifolium]